MSKQTSNKFSPEVRSRAVRLVVEHEHEHPSRWTAIMSIAEASIFQLANHREVRGERIGDRPIASPARVRPNAKRRSGTASDPGVVAIPHLHRAL
jgi:hypothetical protein